MITKDSVDIDAPAELVWEVFADVERWPDWTASVTRLTYVRGGPPLAVGAVAAVEQPRFPRLEWTVTALAEGRSWTWEASSPGVRTVATHLVVPIDERRTRVEQVINQRGPLGAVTGLALRRLTRRYLAQEAAGLKAASQVRAARP